MLNIIISLLMTLCVCACVCVPLCVCLHTDVAGRTSERRGAS